MIIRLTIEDDNGEIIWEEEGKDPCKPFDLKFPPDRPVRSKKYLWYGFVYQPIVKAIYQEQGETRPNFLEPPTGD
jgi:hypothetical protein